MNHDATHCSNYDPNECPKSCYRAQLTEDLQKTYYPWPTCWAMFKYTIECPKWPEKKE